MILIRNLMIAFLVIFLLYRMIWRRRGGDVIVQLLCRILHISEYEAVRRYSLIFRNYEPLFFIFSISLAFFTLLIVTLHAYLRYFEQINQGINALLLEDGGKISLPPELSSVESKLNTVRMTLAKRKHDIETQNQRKDDLILYLAHDIRTPLTSVIGYLDFLAQTQPLSETDQAKYLSIIANLRRPSGSCHKFCRYPYTLTAFSLYIFLCNEAFSSRNVLSLCNFPDLHFVHLHPL